MLLSRFPPVRDLLLYAKYLFLAAKVPAGVHQGFDDCLDRAESPMAAGVCTSSITSKLVLDLVQATQDQRETVGVGDAHRRKEAPAFGCWEASQAGALR